jgi:hypothetical protein
VTYAREEKKRERRGEALVGRLRVGWTLFRDAGILQNEAITSKLGLGVGQ